MFFVPSNGTSSASSNMPAAAFSILCELCTLCRHGSSGFVTIHYNTIYNKSLFILKFNFKKV